MHAAIKVSVKHPETGLSLRIPKTSCFTSNESGIRVFYELVVLRKIKYKCVMYFSAHSSSNPLPSSPSLFSKPSPLISSSNETFFFPMSLHRHCSLSCSEFCNTAQLTSGYISLQPIHAHKYTNSGPGSSAGITTDYGLDGPGSNPGGDEIFCPSRPALGPPVKWVPGLSRG